MLIWWAMVLGDFITLYAVFCASFALSSHRFLSHLRARRENTINFLTIWRAICACRALTSTKICDKIDDGKLRFCFQPKKKTG